MIYLGKIADILLIIGGLNWGLVGLMDMNLVSMIFGSSMMATVVYGLVGLSGVYKIYECFGGGCCNK